MTWIAALGLVLAFMALISLFGVVARARQVIARSRQALADIRSTSLSELDKEHAVQAHARSLFSSFLVITLLSAVALAIPIGLIALLGAVDVVNYDSVLEATLSWQILLSATVIAAVMIAVSKWQQQP